MSPDEGSTTHDDGGSMPDEENQGPDDDPGADELHQLLALPELDPDELPEQPSQQQQPA